MNMLIKYADDTNLLVPSDSNVDLAEEKTFKFKDIFNDMFTSTHIAKQHKNVLHHTSLTGSNSRACKGRVADPSGKTVWVQLLCPCTMAVHRITCVQVFLNGGNSFKDFNGKFWFLRTFKESKFLKGI